MRPAGIILCDFERIANIKFHFFILKIKYANYFRNFQIKSSKILGFKRALYPFVFSVQTGNFMPVALSL